MFCIIVLDCYRPHLRVGPYTFLLQDVLSYNTRQVNCFKPVSSLMGNEIRSMISTHPTITHKKCAYPKDTDADIKASLQD